MDVAGVDVTGLEIAGALALAAFVGVACLIAPRWKLSAGTTFARQNQAYVSPAFVAEFDRELLRRGRGVALVALPALALFVVSIGERSFLAMAAPGLLALPVLGEMLRRVARAGREFAVAPGQPGFARVRAPRVLDYLDRRVLVAHAAQSGIGLVAIIGAVAAAGQRGWSPGLLGVLVAGGLIVLVALLGPGMWQVEVGRPQRATDPAHLYLQDAWRADAMKSVSLLTGPGTLVMMRLHDSGLIGFPISMIQMLLMAVAATCLLIDIEPGTPRFRRQLWPMLAPGQVLMPGEPVPHGAPA